MKRQRRKIKKSLAQHYLVNPAVVKKIAAATVPPPQSTPTPNTPRPDWVIEIAAGTGLLTSELLSQHANVLAIEIESQSIAELEANLAKRYTAGEITIKHLSAVGYQSSSAKAYPPEKTSTALPASESLTVNHKQKKTLLLLKADALKIDYRALLKYLMDSSNHQTRGSICVVGNLPYYAASTIILNLVEQLSFSRELASRIGHLVFLVQKEVALRLAAISSPDKPPSNKAAAGATSYLLAYHARARRRFDVKPGSFYPPPKVMSTVIAIALAPIKTQDAQGAPVMPVGLKKTSREFSSESSSSESLKRKSLKRRHDEASPDLPNENPSNGLGGKADDRFGEEPSDRFATTGYPERVSAPQGKSSRQTMRPSNPMSNSASYFSGEDNSLVTPKDASHYQWYKACVKSAFTMRRKKAIKGILAGLNPARLKSGDSPFYQPLFHQPLLRKFSLAPQPPVYAKTALLNNSDVSSPVLSAQTPHSTPHGSNPSQAGKPISKPLSKPLNEPLSKPLSKLTIESLNEPIIESLSKSIDKSISEIHAKKQPRLKSNAPENNKPAPKTKKGTPIPMTQAKVPPAHAKDHLIKTTQEAIEHFFNLHPPLRDKRPEEMTVNDYVALVQILVEKNQKRGAT